jgi:hypothetical protein
MQILDAISQLSDEDYHHSLRVMPFWEKKVMMEMQLTEDQYIALPRAERARNVCALKLNDWFSVLESELRKA